MSVKSDNDVILRLHVREEGDPPLPAASSGEDDVVEETEFEDDHKETTTATTTTVATVTAVETAPAPPTTFLGKVAALLLKNWFLVGLGFAIGFAAVWQGGGKSGNFWRPEITIKYGLIPLIFFVSGAGLKTKELGNMLGLVHLHLLTQLYNLGFVPTCCFAVASLLQVTTNINPSLLNGLIIMGSVPCTVSMCNIFTQTVDGNPAVSLVNSSLGNLLAVVLTPALLILFLGESTQLDFGDVIFKIGMILFVPFIVGQLFQRVPKAGPFLLKYKPQLKKMNTWILLLIVYSTFCDTFSSTDTDVSIGSFFAIFFICCTLYLFFFGFAYVFFGQKCLNLRRKNMVAACFCAGHKTVAMGLPIISIIYEGRPDIGLISLPLLIYHPSQLVIGSFFLGKIKEFVHNDPRNVEDEEEEKEGGKDVELATVKN
jgi:sodium/bile acid cotransporter 7